MLATEQTWRDSKRLHVVFGITSLLMLVTTVWMLAVDHRRQWRGYQQTFREVESQTLEYRIQQQNNEQFQRSLDELGAQLAAAQHEVPPAALIDKFHQIVEEEAADRGVPPEDFSGVEQHYKQLVEAAEKAKSGPSDANSEALAKKRGQLIRDLEQFVANAKFRENNFLRDKKFQSAEFDVVRSQYEIGVGNELPADQLRAIERKVEEVRRQVDVKMATVENAKVQRLQLEKVLAQIVANESQAR